MLSVRDSIHQLGLDGVQAQGLRQVMARAQVHTLRELVEKAQRSRELPSRLQFRLRYFAELKSNDSGLQGASDEVYLSAICTDSAAVTLGPDGKPHLEAVTTPSIGDVSEDSVRDPWRVAPHVLVEFDLKRPSDWPRSFVVTLLIIESDNGDLVESFNELEATVGKAVETAAMTAASVGATALAGAALGSIIPGVGTAVGAAVGAVAALAYDGVIKEIKNGLSNDVFTPIPIEIHFADPSEVQQHPNVGKPQSLDIRELGAHYTLEYDWFLVE